MRVGPNLAFGSVAEALAVASDLNPKAAQMPVSGLNARDDRLNFQFADDPPGGNGKTLRRQGGITPDSIELSVGRNTAKVLA